ncbi:L,D-transpeptidase, partial [Listeria monocytogenes]|nr:L,D-transpeptidase [Listeria monocytogenes]
TASFAAQETTSESFSEESAASSQEASTESVESSTATESSSTSTSSSETTSSTSTATTESNQTETTQDSSTQSTEESSEEPDVAKIDVKKVEDNDQYVKIKPIAATDPETQKILYRLENGQLIEQGTIDELAGKVYRSVKQYQGTDKQTYLEIRDDQKVVGVVAEAAVKVASGTLKTEKKYATITSAKEPLWQDVFLDKKTSTSSSINGQTFEIKEVFTTNNSVVYYALYSNKNVLIGWIKAAGVKLATSPGGAWQSESKYATIISGNYTLWQNFNWTAKKGTTAALNGKTVKVTGKYRHLNGSTYYSLYTNNNKWLG